MTERRGAEQDATACISSYHLYVSNLAGTHGLYRWNGQELVTVKLKVADQATWSALLEQQGGHKEPALIDTPLGPCWALVRRLRKLRVLILSPEAGPESPSTMTNDAALLLQLAVNLLQVKGLRAELTSLQGELDRTIMAERLRAQAELIASFAHDFNNLFATLLLRAEMAVRKPMDPACQAAVEAIAAKATEGAKIIQRLENFSGTRPSPEQDLLDLGAIVHTIAQEYWDASVSPDLINSPRLRLKCASDLHVLMDVSDVREIVRNLIDNAREATGENGEITVQVARERKQAVLRVADTGSGFSEEALARACEPFFSTRGSGRLGLGLSVVHGIVNRCGGRLEIRNGLSGGAVVALSLPLANLQAVRRKLRQKEEHECETLHNLNILVVDDEAGVRETVALSLESLGHRVGQAADGRQAMGLLRYHDGYDVLVVDLVMPGIDGWEVAYFARKLQPQAAVVLLTAWGDRITDRNDDGRVDAVLAKPVTMDELNQTISKVVGRRRSQDPGTDRLQAGTRLF